jgi:uncharacterized protein YqeY
MTLKQKIQSDFIKAMKAGDQNAKAALSSVKAKITEAEKVKANVELEDKDIIAILSTAIKQRKQSYDAFMASGREELGYREIDETLVLKKYMPAQMSDNEIKTVVEPIINTFKDSGLPERAIIGKVIGEFNKNHKGQAEVVDVKRIVEQMMS